MFYTQCEVPWWGYILGIQVRRSFEQRYSQPFSLVESHGHREPREYRRVELRLALSYDGLQVL